MLETKYRLHKCYKTRIVCINITNQNGLQKCYKPRTVCRNVTNQEQCTEMFQTKSSVQKCFKPRTVCWNVTNQENSLLKCSKPRVVWRNITNQEQSTEILQIHHTMCAKQLFTVYIKFALALTVQMTFEIIVITIFIFQKEYFEVVIVCPCLLVYQLYSAYSKQRNSVIVYFNNTYLLYYRIDCI